jgi:hypothetical protein
MAIPKLSDASLRMMRFADDLASPEEVFLVWLLSLPDGVDASGAAVAEIARLDCVRLHSARGRRLRELFVAATECSISNGASASRT